MPSARKKASRARTSRRTQGQGTAQARGQGYPQVPGHAPGQGQGQGTAPGFEQAGAAVGTMTAPDQAAGPAWQGGAGQDGTTVHAGTGPARTTGRATGKVPLATIKVPEPLARQLRFIAANRPQKTTLSALSEELMAASLSREMARTNKFIEKQQKAAQRGQGGDGAIDH